MSASKKGSEEAAKGGGPFEPEVSEATRYVIDQWGYIEDNIVIEGRITEIFATMHLKRGEYNSDAISATVKMEPTNLKCDLVVPKPVPEIEETGDDLAIVGLVFRRFGAELSLQAQTIMVEHMERCYPEPEKGGTRVAAGERKVASEPESVEF